FFAIDTGSAITNGIIGYKWKFTENLTNSGGFTLQNFVWAPVIVDQTIYVGTEGVGIPSKLFAFDLATGAPRWTNYLGIAPFDPIAKEAMCAVASDGQIYAADTDGLLYSFCLNGTTNWIYDTGTGA